MWLSEAIKLIRLLLRQRWVQFWIGAWTVITSYDTFLSQLAPEWLAQRAPKVRDLILMATGYLPPPWVWVPILPSILFVATLAYAIRLTRERSKGRSRKKTGRPAARAWWMLALGLFLLVALIAGSLTVLVGNAAAFVFVQPGPYFIDNGWEFLIAHRGPNQIFNVRVEFHDRTAPIGSSMLILHYDEIDKNSSSGFGSPRFAWKPGNLENETYDIRIIARDLTVAQTLHIERHEDKWAFATKVWDADTQKILIDCMDQGFSMKDPSPNNPPPCFPDYPAAK